MTELDGDSVVLAAFAAVVESRIEANVELKGIDVLVMSAFCFEPITASDVEVPVFLLASITSLEKSVGAFDVIDDGDIIRVCELTVTAFEEALWLCNTDDCKLELVSVLSRLVGVWRFDEPATDDDAD